MLTLSPRVRDGEPVEPLGQFPRLLVQAAVALLPWVARLGQLAIDAKGNEITAIPELTGLLDLNGAVVTLRLWPGRSPRWTCRPRCGSMQTGGSG